MSKSRESITARTTELVENHSILAGLLAVLCLVFAVNFYMTGPGSDGGSGLGGTGKFGGESGLGGTGKAPDPGSAFKLGATDIDDSRDFSRDLEDHLQALENTDSTAVDSEASLLAFDVHSLRLSPESVLTPPLTPVPNAEMPSITDMAFDATSQMPEIAIEANQTQRLFDKVFEDEIVEFAIDTSVVSDEVYSMSSQALVTSLEIMSSLMLAEAETSLQLAVEETAQAESGTTIRNRISVPVRPERPDRFTLPSRISPVQRANIPAPPPVRPMRTLSSMLNH